MRNRLVCLIVITALLGVFVSVFAFGVGASADDDVLLPAGTYTFNSVLTSFVPQDGINYVQADIFVEPVSVVYEGETFSFGGNFLGFYIGGLNYETLGYIDIYEPSSEISSTIFYNPTVGWNVLYSYSLESGVDCPELRGLGQTFTLLSDTSFPSYIGNWILENLVSDSSLITVESGYYSLREPYINLDASWIGESGQSVYYPVPCSVVNGFNNYVECEGFGIEYLGDGTNYTTLYYVNKGGLRYNWFQLVTTRDSQGYYTSSLQMLGIDDGLTGTKIYFPSSFEMDEQGNLQMFSAFEASSPPAYEGNVFVDLLQYVVEALDVKVFGYFSPLDVVKGIAGLMLGLWLLKLLAGG